MFDCVCGRSDSCSDGCSQGSDTGLRIGSVFDFILGSLFNTEQSYSVELNI